MEMTQINTRIPVSLKRDADEVLSKIGKTSSEVVRALWSYMVEHQCLPECIESNSDVSEDVARRLSAIERATTLVPDFLQRMGLSNGNALYGSDDPEQLRQDMYLEMMREYELLDGRASETPLGVNGVSHD